MGQLIRALVQFAISQLFASKLDRQRVRRLCSLCFKQLMHANVARERLLCLVPLDEQLVLFIISQKLYLRDTLVGIRDDLFKQSPVVSEQAFDSCFLKKIGAVEEKPLQTTGHVPHVTFEIEPRGKAFKLLRTERKTGQLEFLHRRILQRERNLKNRIAAEVARRLQLFDDSFKRQVLMRVGGECQIANAPEQFTKRWTTTEVSTQDEGVDEEADETFDLAAIAISNARSDEDVGLIRVAMKQ